MSLCCRSGRSLLRFETDRWVVRFIPEKAQICMFSATFSDPLVKFAQQIVKNANTITIDTHQIPLETIRQIFMDVSSAEEKYQKVVDMYKCLVIGASIIFCATKATADEIQKRLEKEGHKTVSLHSAVESSAHRDAAIKRFTAGEAKLWTGFSLAEDVESANGVVGHDYN